MESLLASRVVLTPRPPQPRNAVLEVAMLGHCPGRARVQRLLALNGALSDMRAIGFGHAVDALLVNPDHAQWRDLYHLPIPFHSSAEFFDVFPDASQTSSQYVSLLAGDTAWLGNAVNDFFANGGVKLWVVKVPEDLGQAGFYPSANTQLHDVSTLQGLATVLVIPSLGSIAFPDLERIQIPARLADIPRVRLENPDPQFLPCGTDLDDDHRERRYPSEIDETNTPDNLQSLLQNIIAPLAKYRPDLQCLFTLPLHYAEELDTPTLDPAALQTLQQIKQSDSGHLLRHSQFLFPYLRGPRFSLHTPVGVVAGKQAAVAQHQGAWRSAAAQTLQSEGLPYPTLSIAEATHLRNGPGISVLQQRNQQLQLDDERLMVPALPYQDYQYSNDNTRFDGYRSAELKRFLGFLRRQLQQLGEELIFNLDYRDPRPRMLLDHFFRQLLQRGALRGPLPEQAFHINEITSQEGAMIYEILIAPALPIDRLRLTFTNQQGQWQGDIHHV